MPVRILIAIWILGFAGPATALDLFEPPAQPMAVEVGLFVLDITRIDELENTFEIELDVITRWSDPRENPAGDGNAKSFRGDAAHQFRELRWSPELEIANAIGTPNLGRLHTTMQPDGTIVNRARLEATIRAPLDFREFPFDGQSLPIEVESFAFDTEEVQLVVNREFSGFDHHFEMPEWVVKGVDAQIIEHYRPQERRDFSRMEYTVQVERQSGYYLWKVLLPVVLIVAISWVVFWMSSDQLGRRAGISSTGMLTVIAYQFIIAGSLPRFPYLTVLDKIVLLALVLIALTMLENLIGAQMEHESRLRIDRFCRAIFPLVMFSALGILLIPTLVG
jgi:hypothetical protein